MPCKKVKRFRGGLGLKAHRRLYHSTLGLRAIKKREKKRGATNAIRAWVLRSCDFFLIQIVVLYFFIDLTPLKKWSITNYAPLALEIESGSLTAILRPS